MILVGISMDRVPLVVILMGALFLAGKASKFNPLESSSGSLSVTSSKSESWAAEHSKEEFRLLFNEKVSEVVSF